MERTTNSKHAVSTFDQRELTGKKFENARVPSQTTSMAAAHDVTTQVSRSDISQVGSERKF
jgi:hypothetical protein